MVYPKEPQLVSMERLLGKRIDRLFDALDDGYGDLFDEITDEIEMLLKLSPPIFNELMTEKEQLLKEVDKATKSVDDISDYARDDIYKQRFLVGETSSIEWDYRKDYMQVIFDLLGKYQLIPFESPIITQMMSLTSEEIAQLEEQEKLEQEKLKETDEQENLLDEQHEQEKEYLEEKEINTDQSQKEDSFEQTKKEKKEQQKPIETKSEKPKNQKVFKKKRKFEV